MITPNAGLPPGVTDLEADYDIVGEVGRGGMAVVYRARERETGREVAIKVVRAGATSDAAEAHARFEREARTGALLQHPNIVATYAVRSLASGGLAIVMDFVPGRTLKAVVREAGALPVARTRDILRQVADALAYAHSHGVVHRDVKPENIFLDARTGAALLSDFGIARTLESDAALTQTGIAIGTPTYMSPEQIDGRAVDGRGDLYSLGLVGWEMLSGRQPWEGESLYSVIYKQKHDELPALSDLRPDVPEELRYVIERALAKDREERWQSAADMGAALDGGVDAAAVRQWRTRRSRRINPALAAAMERDAVSSETVRFRRDTLAFGDLADEPDEREAARPAGARRTLMIGAGVLAVVLALLAALTLRRGGLTHRDASSEIAAAGAGVPAPAGAGAEGARADDSLLFAPESSAAPAAAGVAGGSQGGEVVAPPRVDAAGVPLPVGTGRVPAPPAPARGAPASNATAAATPAPAPAPAESTTPTETRAVAVSLPIERAPLAAGGRHTCLLTPRGEGRCFGGNERGQLGDGGDAGDATDARVAGTFQFAAVAAGSSHSCGVTRDGGLFCWGANDRGQLGDATTTPRDAPVRVVSDAAFRSVRLGSAHSCALTRAGEVLCWGSNARGQLGDGTTTDHLIPTPIAAPAGHYFTNVAVGWNHSCALDERGRAYCWGDNSGGQLGDGTRSARNAPVPVAGGAEFASISAGGTHSCGVTPRGDAYCWGRNNFGQLGVGRTNDQTVPARVSLDAPLASVAAGGVHTCALTRGGDAYCWGRNTYGQLGDGTNNDSAVPTRVTGGYNFVFINASGAHSCATTAGGESLCWGYNIDGQLGDGTRTHRSRPVKVGAAGG